MKKDEQHFYEFEDFRLDAVRGVLFRDGSVVDITPKAVQILRLLVERKGELVSKEEIFAEVWPDSFVEEANLSHHIFKLRKALRDGEGRKIIETVPKRGYRFVARLAPVASTAEPEKTPRSIRRWPIAVAAILILSLLGGWLLMLNRADQQQSVVADQIRSIAVMPFVNESGNEDVEYLSDGMTDTLINSLAQVPSLSVKSRPAVFKYKGREVTATTVASELNVQAILFGRLTLRGNDLTLFLSLIDPQTENQIWGKQYVRKLSDLVALQNEIGRDVAESLEAKLTTAAADGLTKNYSKNGEAYRLFLLGDYYWAKFTKENLLKAKKYYEDAIAIDPNYTLAYTGLGATYSVLGVNGHIPVSEARPKAREYAERGIQLDPRLAEAHMALGAYKMFFEWDLEGADRDFKRAMELDKEYAVPHELIAYSLRARGRNDEALNEAKRANELDPLNLLMLGDIGVCYRFAGRVEQSIEINNRLLDMDPTFGDARFENALAHSQLGNHERALEEVTKAITLTGNSTKIKSGLGIVHARAGRKAEAQHVIDELVSDSKQNYVSPMDIALIYSVMNDRDKAFEWLEKAYDERTPWLFELNVTPELVPLRDDPRFQDLLKRIGLI